jgi:hypothetical protein
VDRPVRHAEWRGVVLLGQAELVGGVAKLVDRRRQRVKRVIGVEPRGDAGVELVAGHERVGRGVQAPARAVVAEEVEHSLGDRPLGRLVGRRLYPGEVRVCLADRRDHLGDLGTQAVKDPLGRLDGEVGV